MAFPKYLMIVSGESRFLSLEEAAGALSNWHIQVDFGTSVLHEDSTITPMTSADRRKITDMADGIDASK